MRELLLADDIPDAAERPARLTREDENGPAAHRSARSTGPGLSARLNKIAARYAGVRIVPGRPAAFALGLAALLAAVVTACWVLSTRPHAMAVTGPGTAGAGAVSQGAAGERTAGGRTAGLGSTGQGVATPPRSGAAAHSSGASAAVPPTRASSGDAVLVIDVAGKVRHPGVYHLPAGSRIYDAINAAGGALPKVDLSELNLAEKLRDGEQVAVGVSGAGPANQPAATGASATTAGAGGLVNLNTATLEQLESLPGVGPVLGQHILDWRAAHRRFATVDQLREVSGIGPARYASLRTLVSV